MIVCVSPCLCLTIFTVVGDDVECDRCKVVGNVVALSDMKISLIDIDNTKPTIFNLYTRKQNGNNSSHHTLTQYYSIINLQDINFDIIHYSGISFTS